MCLRPLPSSTQTGHRIHAQDASCTALMALLQNTGELSWEALRDWLPRIPGWRLDDTGTSHLVRSLRGARLIAAKERLRLSTLGEAATGDLLGVHRLWRWQTFWDDLEPLEWTPLDIAWVAALVWGREQISTGIRKPIERLSSRLAPLLDTPQKQRLLLTSLGIHDPIAGANPGLLVTGARVLAERGLRSLDDAPWLWALRRWSATQKLAPRSFHKWDLVGEISS